MNEILAPATKVTEVHSVPSKTTLEQNYPNPFNPTTVISYELPVRGHVNVKVYDMLGREIAALIDQIQNAGTYSIPWDASHIPSGLYFCRLTAGGYSKTMKITLVR